MDTADTGNYTAHRGERASTAAMIGQGGSDKRSSERYTKLSWKPCTWY